MRVVAAAAATLTFGVLVACSSPADEPDSSAGSAASTDTLDWHGCGSGECAELDVPVDYQQPDGDQLTISIARVPAGGERQGALFVNPGGPGGTASDFALGLGHTLPTEVTDHFDIVGVDPRGLGASNIDCGADITELYAADLTIDTPEDRDQLIEISEDYVEGCAATTGDMLQHLGTEDVARDIDAVRAAIGDDQLNYLGYSYGTAIGQVLLDLAPDRVRSMVLDGVVELGPSGIELATTQAEGFERAFTSFAQDCDADPSCPLAPDTEAALETLTAKVEEAPIAASPRDLGPGELFSGLAMPLYSEQLWPSLARAIDNALDGDGSTMVSLADQYLSIADFDIYFAVNCLDFAWPDDPDELLAGAKAANASALHFGEAIVNDYVRCAMWPAEAEPLGPVDGDGGPPVVVVSTTNDPATPYEAGVTVAERLVDGRLISYDGEGHTVVGNGVACVDDAVTRYIVDLEAPDDSLDC